MDWSQENRPFRIYTVLEPDTLLLNEFEGEEKLSRFYRYTVRCISKRPDIEGRELLLMPVHLCMRLPDRTDRTIHGIISRLSRGSEAPYGYTAYSWKLCRSTGRSASIQASLFFRTRVRAMSVTSC